MANRKRRGQIPRQGQKSEKDILDTFREARPRDDLNRSAIDSKRSRFQHQNRG